MLSYAVGIEEFARKADNRLASPHHIQAGSLGNGGHLVGFKVFFLSLGDEFVNVLLFQHDSHSLLRFGDGKLGAVQTLVFLAHVVQTNVQSVRKFAYGDTHAACAEVIAAFDHGSNLAVAEKTLYLALGGRIALLDLRAAGLEGRTVVRLG